MKKINYIAYWNKEREKTWSGIVHGIFCALSKYYTLHDINVSNTNSIFIKLYYKFVKNYMGLASIPIFRKYALKNSSESPLYFQFAEIIHEDFDKQTYLFIDCSADYVEYLYKSDYNTFKMSNWSNITYEPILKRSKLQNDYLKKCSGVFTLCHWLVDDLIKRTGVDANKVHYGGAGINVDVEKIDYSKKQHNKILFVGIDFERKGGHLVVEAFKILKNIMPSAELYVAGPSINPITENIDNYYFMGRCTREQLNDLYNKCDIFCMPSYFEAFGIVFVEALTFGLPCIGRDCYDMPHIIESGKTGECIKNDNPQLLSELMYKVLTNYSYFDNVVAKREYYKNEYSWDTVAKRIYNVIG